MEIVPQDLLDSIEVEAHQVVVSRKTGGLALQVHLDKMLDLLDNLIQLSADRFMDLEAPGISVEEQDYKQYIIHPDDIVKARTLTSHLLLRVISSDILVQDDKDDDRMDRSSRLLAHMSGRGGKTKKKSFRWNLTLKIR
jgi:hypothetical protein